MNIETARLRTFLRSNAITGGLISWGWRHYLTALAEAVPDECADIPKVPGAGGIYKGPDDRRYQLMHNGVKVLVNSYYGDLVTEIIRRFRGHHEPQEERVFHAALASLPGEIAMIELGSYWAYYSMWAQAAKRRVRSVLVEPVDSHMEIGKANLELNGMSAEFVRAYIGASSLPPHTVQMEGTSLVGMERLCLDDLLARCGVPFAHIVHVDVQGAEVDMLRGSESAIREKRLGYIFLSTHSRKLHDECLDILKRDFVILAEHTRAESYSTDGLIVARPQWFPGIDPLPISKRRTQNDVSILLRYAFRRR
ncbi:MAG: FkbM family methyltransferase [Bryobacteraceae bacterium]